MDKETIRIKEQEIKKALFLKFGNNIEDFKEKAKEWSFLGTISDYNIIRRFYNNVLILEEEYDEKYQQDLEHLGNTINSFQNVAVTSKSNKLNFSLECVKQIYAVLNGKNIEKKELLQAIYMTIFSKYNDNKNKNNNLVVTDELLEKVWITEDPKDENGKYIISEVGQIYMTYEQYQNFLNSQSQDSASTEGEIKKNTFKRITQFILSSIRNRMMHGDFENLTDGGEKLVYMQAPKTKDFKSIFKFECLNDICSEIAKQLGEVNEDILFVFQRYLTGEISDDEKKSILNNEENTMKILFPLYINSLIVYNFDRYDDFKRVKKQLDPNGSEIKLLNEYYNKEGTSFIGKVIAHNNNYDSNVRGLANAYDCFTHIRNSVAHNYLRFENGNIHILDYEKNENGETIKETANFYIPYELFKELLKEQNKILNLGNNLDDEGGR